MKNIRSYVLGLSVLGLASVGMTSCQDDFDTPAVEIPVAANESNTTIMQLKETYWQDGYNFASTIGDLSDITGNDADAGKHIYIKGRVTSTDEPGNVFKSLYLQDETGAIKFSINSYNLYLRYRRGQEIVVDATGLFIGKYNGTMQIGMIDDNNGEKQVSFLSSELFDTHRELNGMPDLTKIDTIDVPSVSELRTSVNPASMRKYQNQIVRIRNVEFNHAGTATFSYYHSSGVSQGIHDAGGSATDSVAVRTSGYCTFWNNVLPAGTGDIVAMLDYYQTSANNGLWQLTLLDLEGCMNFIDPSERPGTLEKPYTVEEAIAVEANGTAANGWIKGYIVGAVAPGVETVTGNGDIEWTAPTTLRNTLVIAPAADVKDITRCLVVALSSDSPFREFGNLSDNPGNLGKEILVKGDLATYLGTFGITGNKGTTDEFKIDGVNTSGETVPDGDGTEAKPYNVAQVIAKNPSSTQTATETGIYVKGYIVGFMPTGGSSTLLSAAEFSASGATNLNLVLGPTRDCTSASQCIGIQLPTSIRAALNLQEHPENLQRLVTLKGDIFKYCGGPGIKNTSSYVFDGDTPVKPDPTPVEAVSFINQNFDASTQIPAGWSQVQVSGDKSWYVPTFNNNNYAAMTGYKGTQPPFDQWLLTPAVDMSKVTDKKLSFTTQVNGYGSTTSVLEVYVLTSNDLNSATKTKLNPTLATAPASGYSDWAESGKLDLSSFSGTIYIGFRYYATQDANYATWCVDNVVLGEDPNGGGTGGGDEPVTPPAPAGDEVTIAATAITNVPGTTTVDGYTFDIEKNGGKTPPAHHASSSAIRLYADNTIKISGPRMAKIVFTLAKDAGYRYATVSASTGQITPAQATGDTSFTWVGDATEVSFTVPASSDLGSESGKPAQIRFTGITISQAK